MVIFVLCNHHNSSKEPSICWDPVGTDNQGRVWYVQYMNEAGRQHCMIPIRRTTCIKPGMGLRISPPVYIRPDGSSRGKDPCRGSGGVDQALRQARRDSCVCCLCCRCSRCRRGRRRLATSPAMVRRNVDRRTPRRSFRIRRQVWVLVGPVEFARNNFGTPENVVFGISGLKVA